VGFSPVAEKEGVPRREGFRKGTEPMGSGDGGSGARCRAALGGNRGGKLS
jgi:hypothetical protein